VPFADPRPTSTRWAARREQPRRRSVVEGEPRFLLLEAVREYALELLGDDRRRVRALCSTTATVVAAAAREALGADAFEAAFRGAQVN